MNIINFISSLIFLLQLIIFQASGLQPTRNVSINVDDFKLGPIDVYFVCPNIRLKSDEIKFYRIVNHVPVLIKETKNAFGIIIKLKDAQELGTYQCSVFPVGENPRNATLHIMDDKIQQSPSMFVYQNSETTFISKISGAVELNCGTPTTESVNWYGPPQYHIHNGNKYNIADVTEYDYGTYYCTMDNTAKNSVSVKKVILVKEIVQEKENPIEEEVRFIETLNIRSKTIRYRSQKVTKKSDVVEWEQPPGTILLDQGRDIYMKSSKASKSHYYYRITRNGDPSINVVGKLLISKPEVQDVLMDIQGNVAYGSNMKVDCVTPSDLEADTEIVWKRDGKFIQSGNTLEITNFKKDKFGKYSCEISKGQAELKTRYINLMPEQKIESKIEMTPDPGNFYLYHAGSKKEIHCEIGRVGNEWLMKAKDIVWTLNDRKLDPKDPFFAKSIGRLDTNSVSILVIKVMTEKHEGTYKCYQGSTVLTAKLLMERSDVLIEIAPTEQTVADNVNQAAEIHCRIDTANINSSSIIWKFIPEKSNVEIDIPPEARVDRPSMTTSTSFVTIDNVLKRHEGTYVCQVLDRKVLAKLIVKAKPVLTVSPKIITLKPGGTARFLCDLQGIDGKVIWRRMDKKSLMVNKENRLGGSTHSILEIKQVTRDDHGTVYECIFNKLTEYVTLFVQEECALNQRKCKNETCIDETKFCDGKDDCGDNSDEDRQKCNECSPNAIHCDFLNNSNPNKRCIVKHWQCDGVDDCGNNFDELYCPIKNQDRCIGSHFLCNNDTLIPRSYWCDGEPDCKSMEDEDNCSPPQVLEPVKMMQIQIYTNSTVVLTCKISGRPVPTISWRYNWGHLPEGLNHNITTKISNCSVITSTLTINNINTDQAGIYSCEGISRSRVMAPDFSVTVAKGLICKKPYYNNDAWYPDMCIKCFCSNVTDECTSATGYMLNPNGIESEIKPSDAAIVNFQTLEYYAPAREITFANQTLMKYYINETYYKTLVPNPDFYFGGAFNMAGSWLTRYGLPMTFKLILSGDSNGQIPGPIIMIKGESKIIYYCGVKYRLPVFASNDKYENHLRVVLWEQDQWYSDYTCTKVVSRPEFLDILKDVRIILFKVKYFTGQTTFEMSKLTMNEAIETKDQYSWVSRLEKCNCPAGYSGLSCEIKSST